MSDTTTGCLQRPGDFFIGGEWRSPSTASVIEVVNPASEQVFLRVAEAGRADMDAAVEAARKTFDRGSWPQLTHAERAGYLRAIADGLDGRAADLSNLWSSEMGVVHTMATAYGGWFGATFRTYADLAEQFEFEERHDTTGGGEVGLLVREPVGVVGAIVPWNGPMALAAFKVAPALLAGCTVVLKASPEAPGEAYVLAEIAESIDLPPGVLNVVTADRAVSEMLVRDSRVDKISFTGSADAGRRIAGICGERMARFTLELGGKSAAVILDDFDVAQAAATIAGPACWFTGQSCGSLTRIVVGRERHDELVDALSAAFEEVRVGDPFDPSTEMGPLAMRRQRDRVEGFIAKGIAEGATLASGGGRPRGLDVGFYIEPTVFGHVDNSSTIAQEEIFGPVLSVIPANDESHAIEIANDSVYGLNASVFTNDVDHAYRVARQLRSGTVGHNSLRMEYGIAYGGFKQSGVGREGGREGLMPYLETKTIVLDGEPTHSAVALVVPS